MKRIFCVVLVCMVVISMCRVVPVAAKEAAWSESEPESTTEPEIAQSEPEVTTEPDSEQSMESETETIPEQSAEAELTTEPVAEMIPEQSAEAESATELQQQPRTTTSPDYISTGMELINWLETHKNTGGTVKLTDNIVLDGYYFFCPVKVNMPALFVDANRYTITITGEVTFMSDAHLTFYGQAQEKGIFQVAKGGLLFLENIAVEGGQNALWQEESAGMVVKDCHVSGNVHYADMPFVITAKTDCVLVEKGQTAGDVLPAQIKCSVNRQGEVRYNEFLSVSWNLEEGKTQQKKRLRFEAQGAFLAAASKEPLTCTVAYHDYPLTFLDVKAIQNDTQYLFRGGYTKPVEELPIQVAAEYSFDGKNWTTYDEKTVSEALDAFFIGFEAKQWDNVKNPYVYIRLHWNDNGKKRLSNVLRYAAQNLSYADDQGGSRGGGTSIVNPPDEPQNNTETKPSNETKPNEDTPNSTQTESLVNTQPAELLQEAEKAETGQSSQSEQSSQTAKNGDKTNDHISQKTTATDKTSIHKVNETTVELPAEESSFEKSTTDELLCEESMQETIPVAALISETGSHNPPQMQVQKMQPDASIPKTVTIGVGFTALFAVFAAVGYCLYTAKRHLLK